MFIATRKIYKHILANLILKSVDFGYLYNTLLYTFVCALKIYLCWCTERRQTDK